MLERAGRALKTLLGVEKLSIDELVAAVGAGAQLVGLGLKSLGARAPELERLLLRGDRLGQRGLPAALSASAPTTSAG